MKNNLIIKILVGLLIVISALMAYFLYNTIKFKRELSYDLTKLNKVTSDEEKHGDLQNEINNLKVVDIKFPYIKTTIESTATDCTTIGTSIFQKYQVNKIKSNVSNIELEDLQYNDSKIISGNLKDFIIEITFTSRYLDDNSNLLKKYWKDGENKPLFRTRLHIKATEKPMTYELVQG
ncbi:hypothetical protein [Clostridium sp.]|uniref:hypothetical protein n=1 Tax=Clostridium sp. TaxID=1506 RepID=UPI002FCB39DC